MSFNNYYTLYYRNKQLENSFFLNKETEDKEDKDDIIFLEEVEEYKFINEEVKKEEIIPEVKEEIIPEVKEEIIPEVKEEIIPEVKEEIKELEKINTNLKKNINLEIESFNKNLLKSIFKENKSIFINNFYKDDYNYYFKYINNFYFENEKLEENINQGPTGFINIDNTLKVQEYKSIIKNDIIVNNDELFKEISVEVCEEIITDKITDEILLVVKQENVSLNIEESLEREILHVNKETNFINEINPEINPEIDEENTYINYINEIENEIDDEKFNLEINDSNIIVENKLNVCEDIKEIQVEIKDNELENISNECLFLQEDLFLEEQKENDKKDKNLVINENSKIYFEKEDEFNNKNIEKQVELEWTVVKELKEELEEIIEKILEIVESKDIEIEDQSMCNENIYENKNIDIINEVKVEYFCNEEYIKHQIELLEINKLELINTFIIEENINSTVDNNTIETKDIEREVSFEFNKDDNKNLNETIYIENNICTEEIEIINDFTARYNKDEKKYIDLLSEIQLEINREKLKEIGDDIIHFDKITEKKEDMVIIEIENEKNIVTKEINLINIIKEDIFKVENKNEENIINLQQEIDIIDKIKIPNIKYLNCYVINNENEYWKLYYNELTCKDTLNNFKIYLYINYNNEIKIIPVLSYVYNEEYIKGILEESKLYNNFTIEAFIHLKNWNENDKVKYKLNIVNVNDITEKLEYKFYFNSRWYECYRKITDNKNMLQTGLKVFNNTGFYDGENFILFEDCIPMLTKINYKLLK
jgi:hypothetical protein